MCKKTYSPSLIPLADSADSAEADAINIDYKSKYSAQQQVIKGNYATFKVPYNGEDNNDYERMLFYYPPTIWVAVALGLNPPLLGPPSFYCTFQIEVQGNK